MVRIIFAAHWRKKLIFLTVWWAGLSHEASIRAGGVAGLHSRSASQTVCSLKNCSGPPVCPTHSWPVTSANWTSLYQSVRREGEAKAFLFSFSWPLVFSWGRVKQQFIANHAWSHAQTLVLSVVTWEKRPTPTILQPLFRHLQRMIRSLLSCLFSSGQWWMFHLFWAFLCGK